MMGSRLKICLDPSLFSQKLNSDGKPSRKRRRHDGKDGIQNVENNRFVILVPRELRFISDLSHYLVDKFSLRRRNGGNSRGIRLWLEGFELPVEESIEVLRDGDLIRVTDQATRVASDLDNSLGLSIEHSRAKTIAGGEKVLSSQNPILSPCADDTAVSRVELTHESFLGPRVRSTIKPLRKRSSSSSSSSSSSACASQTSSSSSSSESENEVVTKGEKPLKPGALKVSVQESSSSSSAPSSSPSSSSSSSSDSESGEQTGENGGHRNARAAASSVPVTSVTAATKCMGHSSNQGPSLKRATIDGKAAAGGHVRFDYEGDEAAPVKVVKGQKDAWNIKKPFHLAAIESQSQQGPLDKEPVTMGDKPRRQRRRRRNPTRGAEASSERMGKVAEHLRPLGRGKHLTTPHWQQLHSDSVIGKGVPAVASAQAAASAHDITTDDLALTEEEEVVTERTKRPYEVIASIHGTPGRENLDPNGASSTATQSQTLGSFCQQLPTSDPTKFQFSKGDVLALRTMTLCEDTWQPVLSDYRVVTVREVRQDMLLVQEYSGASTDRKLLESPSDWPAVDQSSSIEINREDISDLHILKSEQGHGAPSASEDVVRAFPADSLLTALELKRRELAAAGRAHYY